MTINNVIMKNLYVLVFLAACVLTVASCSTTTKITIEGEPGTEIYKNFSEKIGTIDNSGQLQINWPDDEYIACMLSKAPGTDMKIPFALNYTHRNMLWYNTAKYTVSTVLIGGTGTTVIGTIVLLAGGPGSIAAVGGIVTLVSIAGLPILFMGYQDAYEYQYKYLSTQKTNADLVFKTPLFSEPEKSRN